MRKQYLHLSAYPCDRCGSPVIAGSLGVRENEISKETGIRQVGAICLACGHRQTKATEPARPRHLSPMEWESVSAIDPDHLTAAFVEALNRGEPR
jgi:DNA-directed RNA polymerase subunit RPC12/RpoP